MNASRLPVALIVSAVAIVLMAVAVLAQIPATLSTAFMGVGEVETTDRNLEQLLERHRENMALAQERFVGRSVFFVPDPPPPPPRTVVVDDRPPPPPPGPGPAPSQYAGPAPSAIIGDVVFFGTGSPMLKIRQGESAQNIRVIEINAPWTVRVAWQGPGNVQEGEYVINLFHSERNVGLLTETRPPSRTPTGLREAPPDPTPASRERTARDDTGSAADNDA